MVTPRLTDLPTTPSRHRPAMHRPPAGSAAQRASPVSSRRRGRGRVRPSVVDVRLPAFVALGIASLFIAIRMAIFAARLSASDERVRWLLLVTEPAVEPFRLMVDATAAHGTIEGASVVAGCALLIAWSFVLARVDRGSSLRG